MNFPFDIFKDIPPEGHLYFFYGLAFFSLGISILLTYKRSGELIIARSLWLLASFGITHGIYVWLELFLLLQEQNLAQSQFFLFHGLIVLMLIISFLLLTQFGLVLIVHTVKNRRRKLLPVAVPVILFSLWALSLWSQPGFTANEFLNVAYRSTRHTFGLFGSLLAAYGLWSYSHDMKSVSIPGAKNFLYSGIVFLFYGIAAGIVPSHTRLPYVHIPIEVVRTLSVFLITYFILNAMNIFDIEVKRQLEKQVRRFEQSEKLISIGRLAAGVAHEINNPLANASLNVEILRDRLKHVDNPEILTRLNNMEKNISKAATIAKELLQFSRNTESDMVPVDINSIIKGSLTLMEHKFKGMSVHTNLSPTPKITGDPVKLEQVMMNILDNAQHAMSHGDEVRIESSIHDGSIEITVTDSGKGISQENLPKIFDPFFTTKGIGVGTGLGLSICYGIIDQHKGEISIDSKEGEGTRVTITLPVADPHDT
jgi:signal transduction histidine kinase